MQWGLRRPRVLSRRRDRTLSCTPYAGRPCLLPPEWAPGAGRQLAGGWGRDLSPGSRLFFCCLAYVFGTNHWCNNRHEGAGVKRRDRRGSRWQLSQWRDFCPRVLLLIPCRTRGRALSSSPALSAHQEGPVFLIAVFNDPGPAALGGGLRAPDPYLLWFSGACWRELWFWGRKGLRGCQVQSSCLL